MAWFDIGVNLTNPRLDTLAVLARAAEEQVTHMAITGTDLTESQLALDMCHSHPDYPLVATAGVHPHYAKDVPADYIDSLTHLLAQPEVVAVGECGLDFNRNFSPPEMQLQVFEQQLQLAAELQKPVFLHERDAHEQQLSLLKKYMDKIPGGVAHCFTGDKLQMLAYLSLGLHIGITGWLCDDKRGLALQQAVSELPLERLLLETDAPYLMPKNLQSKSKQNEPANLPVVAERAANCMQVSLADVEQHSFENACRLFGLEVTYAG